MMERERERGRKRRKIMKKVVYKLQEIIMGLFSPHNINHVSRVLKNEAYDLITV